MANFVYSYTFLTVISLSKFQAAYIKRKSAENMSFNGTYLIKSVPFKNKDIWQSYGPDLGFYFHIYGHTFYGQVRLNFVWNIGRLLSIG